MTLPASVDELTAGRLSEALQAPIRSTEVLDAHSGTTGRVRLAVVTDARSPSRSS